MAVTSWLARAAAAAPVPVFAVSGLGARETTQHLSLGTAVKLVDTPRRASILFVAGFVPDSLTVPLARIHDSMAHPRATVLASGAQLPQALAGQLRDAVATTRQPEVALIAAYQDLLAGRRASEPAILPDVDPAPWRGLGPYGQGGTGMTGGVPYGRPMAELAPDPDGLQLDVLPVAVGPLFARFPVGLVVDVRWAGDLVLDATISNALDGRSTVPIGRGLEPFIRALSQPVSVTELELARAREHLRSIADSLTTHGLRALGVRALRLATRLGADHGSEVRGLARLVERSQIFRWSVPRRQTFERQQLAGLGLGPVARAAGLDEDVRTEDSAYRELGFEPLLLDRGDVASRLRLRLAECTQSLELASRAGRLQTTATGRVESPRGRLEFGSAPADRLLPLIGDAIRETEWGDAVSTIVSLALDLEEAAAVQRAARQTVAA